MTVKGVGPLVVEVPHGLAVSTTVFGSHVPTFESHLRRNSQQTQTTLHCTEPFTITLNILTEILLKQKRKTPSHPGIHL